MIKYSYLKASKVMELNKFVNKLGFKKLLTIVLLTMAASLTITLLVESNSLKPTIPTTQIYLLTTSSDILTTRDSFINFVINFRLIESILFLTLSTLIYIDYLDKKKYNIVFLTTLLFITTLFFNQLVVKNPYPTIPVFRKYLGLHVFSLDYTCFIILVVFLIVDLTILALVIYSVGRVSRVDNTVRNALLVSTLVLILTIITKDIVIAYILLNIVFLTLFTTLAVGKH